MFKSFSLTALVSVFFVQISQAQIVYTDIPDGVPSGFDFNNDGVNEFDLSDIENPGDYITYSGDNNIHASAAGWDVPSCEPMGYSVGMGSNWQGAGDCSIDNWGGVNPTITISQDEYLAVRISLSNSTYYGWVRFSVGPSGAITYKDYAYNSTVNGSINTGDEGSAVVLVNSIVISGNNVINMANGTTQLTGSVLPADATDNSFTWSVIDGTGSASISSTGLLTAISDGSVSVKAVANDDSGIEGTLEVEISNQTIGIMEVESNGTYFYPNPAKDIINFNTTSVVEVSVYSLNGKVVLHQNKISSNQINIDTLVKGIYLLETTDTNGQKYSSKLIKL